MKLKSELEKQGDLIVHGFLKQTPYYETADLPSDVQWGAILSYF